MSVSSSRVESIESLYVDHHGWLLAWLRYRLGSACDGADIAQDTFLRLMARTSSLGLGSEPRAFLTHVAKGLVVDHWRRRAVEQAYLDAISHLPEPEVPSPEAHMIIVESLLRIDAMLAEIPRRTREIFLLAQLDGLTLQQISKQVQMPVITVRRHIHRALVACMAVA